MLKELGNKVYLLVVIILIFSIIYQTGFLIVNANNVITTTVEPTTNNDQQYINEEKSWNLYLYLIKQVIPYNGDNSTFADNFKSAVEYFTKIDIEDPKTLISAQMPILSEYEYDDVKITTEEEKEIYNLLTQKPMNNEDVQVGELDEEQPVVLIYHTHATESYTSSSKTKIDYSSYCRSLNEEYNMVAIGEEVTKILEEKYGVKVIHDKTIHDYPDYDKSYSNSLNSIQDHIKKYPTIKYAFDIHRDGLTDNEVNRKKYLAVYNNVNTAKIMIVLGMNHFNSQHNKVFANQIYQELESLYPEITLPVIERENRKYNQFVTNNAVLFEVGSNLSTLEEAEASAECLGNALGKLIVEQELN